VGADVSFTDGATSYGAGFVTNLSGPLAIGADFSVTDVDGMNRNFNTFGGRVAYELPVTGFSACPVVGASYSSFSDRFEGVDVDITSIALPVGFSVGTRIDLPSALALIPSGGVNLLYFRNKLSASGFGENFSESDTRTEFGGGAGFTLAFNQLFGRAGVSVTTVEQSDPVVSLTFGFKF
jgi:hypothetical protein